MFRVRRLRPILVWPVDSCVCCGEGAAHDHLRSCQRYGCLQANEGAEAELRAGGSLSPQEDRAESHRVLCAGQALFRFSNTEVYQLVFKRQHFAFQDDSRISAKSRDDRVEDLWSLTSFFGYSTQTFVLAVNLLDRFLAMMKVRWSRLEHKCIRAFLLFRRVTQRWFFLCALASFTSLPNRLPADPTQAPVVCQPQLPPHGGQSDGGGVQPHALRRAHSHRPVPLHRVRPGAHGEDCRREAQLQIQSRHCLNLPALVPSAHAVARHRQVRPPDLLPVSAVHSARSQPHARRLRNPENESEANLKSSPQLFNVMLRLHNLNCRLWKLLWPKCTDKSCCRVFLTRRAPILVRNSKHLLPTTCVFFLAPRVWW